MRMLLSRCRNWAEDRHLDVILELNDTFHPTAGTQIQIQISDGEGQLLSSFDIAVPAPQFVTYPDLPAQLQTAGGNGRVDVAWLDEAGTVLATAEEPFRVELAAAGQPRQGEISLRIDNPLGVTAAAIPFTTGVPFPRGKLDSAANLQLFRRVGTELKEVPLQANTVARWSRFGSVKWVHCDFTLDLDGQPIDLILRYGPDVSRTERESIVIQQGSAFPVVDAGRIRLDDGIWLDAELDGTFVQALKAGALHGAFVEHENGRRYEMSRSDSIEIEEAGPEKVVLKREGWYREVNGDGTFCKYISRTIIHRNSPLIRIFNTWIFTGDGNRDRIQTMGWQFPLASPPTDQGFITEFGSPAQLFNGSELLQYNYDVFEVRGALGNETVEGGRAPGVAYAFAPGSQVWLGSKDFWQNFPSEMRIDDQSLWFHNWPNNNKPSRVTYDPALLGTSQFNLDVVRAQFAHEGEVLDFRLPDVFADPEVWTAATRNGGSLYWLPYQPESANAQGIARTEEMWLYLTPPDADPQEVSRLLEGLNNEELRAIVDPKWIAATGAFYEFHPQDRERFPEEEETFEMIALAPINWVEWLGFYGMWNYGDIAAWSKLTDIPSLYRARRKRHHGWPYSWQPFARSGDSRFLKFAEAATRQMIDANFCHYVSDDVVRLIGPDQRRFVGQWGRATLPWVGEGGTSLRTYELNVEFNLHAWYLTGFHRSLDYLQLWADRVKVTSHPDLHNADVPSGPRGHRSGGGVIKDWLEAYEATFDPWFISAAHALAKSHLGVYHERRGQEGAPVGHWYKTGDREFMRFTGCESFLQYYLDYADYYGDHRIGGGSWGRIGAPMVESQSYAWLLTGDDYYLARVANWIDWIKKAVYTDDLPAHTKGQYTSGHGSVIFAGYALNLFPAALAAVAAGDPEIEPIGTAIRLQSGRESSMPQRIVMIKESDKPLDLELAVQVVSTAGGDPVPFKINGPDGTTVLQGEWNRSKAMRLSVDAEAPPGEYSLWVDSNILDVPVSDRGIREVMVFDDPSSSLPGMFREGRAWFFVPPDVENFTVVFHAPGSLPSRASIWNADGEMVWNHNYPETAPPTDITATIAVPADQRGRLWQVSLPGIRTWKTFLMDERIPAVYSTEKGRWFMPAQ